MWWYLWLSFDGVFTAESVMKKFGNQRLWKILAGVECVDFPFLVYMSQKTGTPYYLYIVHDFAKC